jgi:hypothetical protein
MDTVFNYSHRVIFDDKEAAVMQSTPTKYQNNKSMAQKQK